MSTALFEKLHPRAGDGTFTEKFQSPGTAVLDSPAAAMAVDLDWVDGIRQDLHLALQGPKPARRTMVGRSAWVTTQADVAADEADKAAVDAARESLDIYGGPDLAVAAIGSAVADRAEILAGITVTEIRAGWGRRLEEAHTEYEDAYQATLQNPSAGLDRWTKASSALGKAKSGTDEKTMQDLRRLSDGYLASLREIRPMGGELKVHPESDASAVELAQEAAQFFPTDFINASNAGIPLHIKNTEGRAHYVHGTMLTRTEKVPSYSTKMQLPGAPKPVNAADREWELIEDDESSLVPGAKRYRSRNFDVLRAGAKFKATKDGSPSGKGWEQWKNPVTGEVSWRRPRTRNKTTYGETVGQLLVDRDFSSYMEGRTGSLSTAVHEFSHRVENVVRPAPVSGSAPAVGVAALEALFLKRRTTFEDANGNMVRQKMERIAEKGAMSKEYCRPDHFPERYMGKEYKGDNFELLSLGMEALFAGRTGGFIGIGRHDSDRETRDFILGTLAVAHAPAAVNQA